ncbi:MAG: hypothetical protein RLP09_16545 [Sandaracinaceae bacterium]|mgnify:CR=1 FL=1|nr:MAG: hypothetical protein EVA89_20305 [Sandaracinaceae bacterium]
MTDVDRAREYFRLVSEVGHEGFLARIAIAELAPLRVALERVGAPQLMRLLDEAVLIDLDSRDAAGRATRQYLEVEEAALERLDRELFEALHRLGPALDIRAA